MEGLVMNPSFWAGRKVFLTGHTGFKGSWLSQWLIMLGAHVKGYSLDPPTEPSLFKVLNIKNNLEHIVGDICDYELLEKEIVSFSPEVVFHLAAQPLVRISYKEPRKTYRTNVMGTLNLYEAVKKCLNVKAIVSITTDKCYENKERARGYKESDPMGGFDPYSSSKGCVEILSASYRRSYFNQEQYGKSHQVALATARAGNVIGGGDWAMDRIFPDCILALSQKEKIRIRNPYAIRPWQHVLEPLNGYLILAEQLFTKGALYAEGWNFGPGEEGILNVENLVKEIIAFWGQGSYEVMSDEKCHEAQLLKLDSSKAKERLHWYTHFTAIEAIDWSTSWYRSFIQGQNITKLTEEQLIEYLNIIKESD
jgi:CDP-glucose 4,6-dehydratase